MIKTIVSLFAIYQSSLGNRLLLQGQGPPSWVPTNPPVDPVAPPVDPVPPVQRPVDPVHPIDPVPPHQPTIPQPPIPQAPPVQPVQPAQPVQPVTPVVIQPPAVVQPQPQPAPAPVFPWQQQPAPAPPVVIAPPVVVQPPAGQPPAVGHPPVSPFPWQGGGGGVVGQPPSYKMECKITPPTAGTCSGTIKTITNPTENYEVLCSARGGCYGTTINVELTTMGFPIERMKGFWCTHEYACANAVININNLRGDSIRIDEIKCDKPGACQNTHFTFGAGVYLDQGDFFCSWGACDGCTINGYPCYYFVEPI